MAFPTVSTVLDTFDRANSGTLGANWTGTPFSAATRHQILSNTAAATGAAVHADYWNVATYGPDCEAWFEIAVLPADSSSVGVFCRGVQLGSGTGDGYLFVANRVAGTNVDTYILFRVDDGVNTQLGSTTTGPDYAVGDAIGIEVIGTAIKGYLRQGGTWTQKVSATNANHTAAGAAGIRLRSTGAALEFVAGTIGGVAPVNTVAPAVTVNGGGTPTVGATASCTTGTWDNDPDSFTYDWLRDGVPIGTGDATDDNDYTFVTADIGADITCEVTATNEAGSDDAVSNEVGPIGPLYAGTLDASGLELIGGEMTGSYSVDSPFPVGKGRVPHQLAPKQLQTLGPANLR